MVRITHSSLSLFKNCRKKYYFRIVLGLTPLRDRPKPLYFGQVIHSALAAYLLGDEPAKVLKTTQVLFTDFPSLNSEDQARILAMVKKYMAHYPQKPGWVLAIEEEFLLPLNPYYAIGGKIDGLVQGSDGYYLLEHKTTSQLNQGYIEKIWVDPQLLTYSIFYGKASHTPIIGCIYDILEKPQIKRKKSETIQDFGDRCFEKTNLHQETIFFTKADKQAFAEDLNVLMDQLTIATQQNHWYKNPQMCWNWNRRCPYYELCKSNGDPILIENHYEKIAPHQELSLSLDSIDALDDYDHMVE